MTSAIFEMLTISEISKLSVTERIELVEEIWDSIASEPHELPLTNAQRIELDASLADYEKNPKLGSSWKETKKSIINLT